jgi:sigma-B regulation protein RsbU (phosphoserine phosphatase)
MSNRNRGKKMENEVKETRIVGNVESIEVFSEFLGMNKAKKNVIKTYEPKKIHGEVIGKIVSSFYFAFEDVVVEDLANELLTADFISVVGVVDKDNRAIGVISKKDLFFMLSKPFGRELYTTKSLKEIAQPVETFHFNRNVLSVAEQISDKLSRDVSLYYILHVGELQFAGIFSTNDMLLYLSDITQRDISLAKKLQSLIVKDEDVIDTDICSIVGASNMARGVGGDYYSVNKYNETNWLLALCDVSGKGMAASMLSVLLDGMLSIHDLNRGVKDYIVSINDYIHHSFNFERFITGVFVDFNEETGVAHLYDMGHSYCYLFRDGKLIKIVTKDGSLPIGVAPDCNPRANTVQLRENDLLMLITDGIEEQKDPDGNEFGIKRIIPVLRKYREYGPKVLKDQIFSSILSFRKNQTQLDDISVLFLEYKGK